MNVVVDMVHIVEGMSYMVVDMNVAWVQNMDYMMENEVDNMVYEMEMMVGRFGMRVGGMVHRLGWEMDYHTHDQVNISFDHASMFEDPLIDAVWMLGFERNNFPYFLQKNENLGVK